ncbi:hypothetical protein [Flaviflagellibacter deserti]|uniref:Polysaccharide polymerase n=1 Tax=Flaviflagellibacter deserti TaxID=2267266 RepID=A0ABV9Z388_9HYPH
MLSNKAHATGGQSPFWTNIEAILVVFAVSFNALLAIVNANFLTMSPATVIACEIVVVLIAHAIIIWRYNDRVTAWYYLLGLLMAVAVARWMFIGRVDAKALRDGMLISTFVALGIVSGRAAAGKCVFWLQIIVTLVAIIELFATDLFVTLFNVKQFYISTRGFSEANFWNTDSALFVSATRPGERNLFPFLNIHRASSIFLEPVSLGNYCIILVAYVSTEARSLSGRTLAFYILSTIFLLIACDGRLAVIVSIFIILLSFVKPIVRYSSLLYIPVLIVVSFVLLGFGAEPSRDDLAGRAALAAKIFYRFDAAAFFGISNSTYVQSADSGITYLIATQSIFGAMLILIFVTFNLAEGEPKQALFKRAALIFLTTTMLISNSYLSIKTAALLWFLLGAYQTRPILAKVSSYRDVRPVGTASSVQE